MRRLSPDEFKQMINEVNDENEMFGYLIGLLGGAQEEYIANVVGQAHFVKQGWNTMGEAIGYLRLEQEAT